MNNERSSNRLDRIENALDRITYGLEETKAIENKVDRILEQNQESSQE